MIHPVFSVTVFAVGVLFGIVIALQLQSRNEHRRIEKALDTIGIRRKEFVKLDGMVRSLQQTVATNTNRLGYLEQRRK